MRRQTFLLLGAVLWACNSDTFTGDDGGHADGSSDVVVGGGEGGSTEGGIGKDGSTTPKRFCQEVDAQFCADFDVPNDAGAGFSPPTTSNGYALDFQSGNAKSQPVAVKVTEPGDAGGQATLMTVLGNSADAGATAQITLDIEVYLPNITTVSTQPIWAFAIGALGPQYQFGLVKDGPVWRLENFQTAVGPQFTGTIATGEWVHATETVVLAQTGATVTLAITSTAGTATATLPNVSTEPGPGPLPVVLNLGVQTTVPVNQAASFYYDNVVVHYL